MITTSRFRKFSFLSLPSLGLLAAAGLTTGCDSGSGGNFLADLTPPTPSEAARDAFNVYDADLRRRSVALLSASSFGGEAPYVRMYRLLATDTDPTVRAACYRALGLHGTVDDAPILIKGLDDEVNFIRWEAARALQKIHSPEAIDPLMTRMLEDRDADVRQACATALGQYATPSVYQALVSALDDNSFSVQLAASRSLKVLTGQDLGVDPRDWLAWSETPGTELFAQGKEYTWQPFHRDRSFVDKTLLFWVDRPAPDPRAATTDTDADRNLDSAPDASASEPEA